MSSPSQRRGSCGHMMAGFDFHTVCARCRDKKKGQDPCVEKPGSDCLHCNSLTPEQLAQLSTPSYKIKKERRVLQSSTPAKNPQASDAMLSPTLVDPALVEVEDGQSTSRLPGLSEQPVEKKKKKHEKKVTSSKSVKPEKSGKSTSRRPSSSDSTDQKLEVMEQKWLDRLEALLLAKSLDRPQEPVFSAVKVAPPHAPPANVVRQCFEAFRPAFTPTFLNFTGYRTCRFCCCLKGRIRHFSTLSATGNFRNDRPVCLTETHVQYF